MRLNALEMLRANAPVLMIVITAGLFTHCAPHVTSNQEKLNTSHLDALYEEKVVGKDTVGIIHIYAEYPEYHWKGDDNEGIACVDDASRASIFYLREHKVHKDPEHLRKARMLLRFLLVMQADNGYYYNFIWPDGSINTEGITSKPEPDWWSWRVLWAFSEALQSLDKDDPLIPGIHLQLENLISSLLQEKNFQSGATDTAMGITIPTWLPKGSGTDQASIILVGLSGLLESSMEIDSSRSDSIRSFLRHFAEGISMTQVNSPDSLHDGAFLSWENLWHAYGNIQSYALLTAGKALNDSSLIQNALYELDHFYPALHESGGLDHFWVKRTGNLISRYDSAVFPQIAYGKRPMIFACVRAYEITGNKKYIDLARDLTGWFMGQNLASTVMFDIATGRGYDGISSPDQINKNAGAESTIESLLSLQIIQKYK